MSGSLTFPAILTISGFSIPKLRFSLIDFTSATFYRTCNDPDDQDRLATASGLQRPANYFGTEIAKDGS
jgi:hypothetical protein